MFKAFHGNDLKALFAQIRKEMGEDALILQQRVLEDGNDELPQFEVLARRPDRPVPIQKKPELAVQGNQLLVKELSATGYGAPAAQPRAMISRERRKGGVGNLVSNEKFVPPVLPLDLPAIQEELPVIKKKRPRRQVRVRTAGTYCQPSIPLDPQPKIHKEPSRPQQSTPVARLSQPQPQLWERLYEYLREQDIDRKVAMKICERLQSEFGDSPSLSANDLRPHVQHHLTRSIKVEPPLRLKNGAVKLMVMLGPTGVGKTTTAVKLAVKYALNEFHRVAFLTTDTSRLGAADQLSRYADVLKVPCSTVFDMKEMQAAVESLSDHDVIIIDTAGCSPNDEDRLGCLQRWLATLPYEQERFLVVSATTNRRDLYRIVERFSDLDYGKYIFTKLDETSCLGSIFNLLQYSNKPAAYIANGQEISGHLEPISPKKLVRNILADY